MDRCASPGEETHGWLCCFGGLISLQNYKITLEIMVFVICTPQNKIFTPKFLFLKIFSLPLDV